MKYIRMNNKIMNEKEAEKFIIFKNIFSKRGGDTPKKVPPQSIIVTFCKEASLRMR